MNVIGNKASIAIEYVLTDSVELMGYARFWFSNQPLGSLEDLIYFEGYLLGCLEDLLRKPGLPECYDSPSVSQTFALLEKDLSSFDEEEAEDFSERARPFFLTCGTLFDDFLVFSHRRNHTFGRVIWRLETPEQDLVFADLKGTSRAVCSGDFSYREVDELANQLRAVLRRAQST
ncbi:hypothetical protein [Pseudomonas sp. JV241A]|uniref:hypothetical protein n=1 Tax=Pseudomonas sp. JV241A TaxID=2078785 RepID=UPI00100D3361|nr:hypothetical protein [Pseudomonas sp. JV241A]SPO68357.1 conserved protein of unknown function [Pseudomonas sp. JV241A]